AAALAFCDVSLPAVGEGLPQVGCPDASVAAASRAAATRYLKQAMEALCLMADALLSRLNPWLDDSLLRYLLPPSGRSGITTIVRVERRHHFVCFFVYQRQCHLFDICSRIGARACSGVGNHPTVAAIERELHVHRDLIDRHHRIARGLRGNQASQHKGCAEALRSTERCIGVVLEVCIDLGLGNLAADLFWRIGLQS